MITAYVVDVNAAKYSRRIAGPFLSRATAERRAHNFNRSFASEFEEPEPARVRELQTERLPFTTIEAVGAKVSGDFDRLRFGRSIKNVEQISEGVFQGVISLRGERMLVAKHPDQAWQVVELLGPGYQWPAVKVVRLKAGDIDRAVSSLRRVFNPRELRALAEQLQAG